MPKRNRRDQIRDNIKGGKKKGKQPGNTPLTAPLSTPQARNMAKSEARAEYGPTIRGAKHELAGSRYRQNQEIPAWFGQLQGRIGETATQTDASYNQANAALLAHMQAAQNAAAQNQGQIASQQAATAGLTGSDPSLQLPALQEGAAAANQRQITGAALAAPIAAAGANQASYLRNTSVNAGREGIAARQRESKRQQEIREDLTALRKERAQKAVGNFRSIRGEERDYGIQRAAFKLDKTTAQQDAEQAAADRALEEAKFGETARHNRATERNSADGGGKGLTPSEKRASKEGRKGAMAAGRNLIQANGVPKSAKEWAGLQALLEDKEEISPQEASYAVKKLKRQLRRQSQNATFVPDPVPFP